MRAHGGTRDTLLILLVPLLLFGGCILDGSVWLPRHSATQDLPWSALPDATHAGEPRNTAFSDPVNLILPDVHFAREELSAGRWPLWNPAVFCGTAQCANPLAGTFYPPQWLAAVFDPFTAMGFLAALHLLLGGFFFRFWMRQLGLGSGAALFGAVSFQCSGWMAAHLHNHPLVASLVWVVLAFAAVEWRLNTSRRAPLFVLGLAIGCAWLAGFPQLAVLGTLAVAAYTALLLIFSRRAPLKVHALPLAVALLLGLGIASVQILPVLAARGDAARQGATAEALIADRLRPAATLGWVLPRTLGDPMAASDWREQPFAQFFLGEGASPVPPPAMNWSERTLHPGWIVLLLALLSPGLLRRGSIRIFTLLATLGLVHAFCPAVIRSAASIPGFNIGAPIRSSVLLVLLMPLLAAATLHALLELRELEGCRPAPWRRRALWLAAGVLLTAALLLQLFPAASTSATASLLAATQRGAELALDRATPEQLAALTRPATVLLARDLTLAAAAAVLLAVVLELSLRRRRADPGFLLALLSMAELLSFALPVNLPVTRDALFEPTPAIRFLEANTRSRERIMRVSKDSIEALAESGRLLIPNLPGMLQLQDVQGWREQVPRHVLETWKGVAAGTLDVAISGTTPEHVNSPLLDLARVRWLVASGPIPALAAMQVFPRGMEATGDLVIYENPGIMPEAWIVHAVRHADTQQAAAWAQAPGAPLATEAVIDPAFVLPVVEPLRADSVRVTHAHAGELELTLDAGSAGVLVIPETFDHGWVANVESSERTQTVSPVRCDAQFIGVPVSAGHQKITLRFAPRSVRTGVVLAGGSLFALLLLALWPRRELPRAEWP